MKLSCPRPLMQLLMQDAIMPRFKDDLRVLILGSGTWDICNIRSIHSASMASVSVGCSAYSVKNVQKVQNYFRLCLWSAEMVIGIQKASRQVMFQSLLVNICTIITMQLSMAVSAAIPLV